MIGIASDHGGFKLKNHLADYISNSSVLKVVDMGCYDEDSTDYPVWGHTVADGITEGKIERGIIICGTGIGISISANRHPGIRAALCYDVTTARLAREHNDANILALGARMTAPELAQEIVDTFLHTSFEGGRHARRVAGIEPKPKQYAGVAKIQQSVAKIQQVFKEFP